MKSGQGLKVGCCGFPLSLVQYAGAFPVVEVQQTFYQLPLVRTLEKWRGQVTAEFEFTLKAWQVITHEASSPTYRRLREKLNDRQKREVGAFRLNQTVLNAWQRTLQCARVLGSSRILFQCPARFTPTAEHKRNLVSFFREIRREVEADPAAPRLTLIWEPRGEWQPQEVKELCTELGLVHGVDPLQHQPVTSCEGYFRLHGRTGYRYQYTDSDLRSLLDTIRGRKPCYVLFNNISMLEDARRFLKLASKA